MVSCRPILTVGKPGASRNPRMPTAVRGKVAVESTSIIESDYDNTTLCEGSAIERGIRSRTFNKAPSVDPTKLVQLEPEE